VKKKMESTRKSLYWNSFLVFLVEGSLEIYIGIFLNLTYQRVGEEKEGGGGAYFGPWNNRFDIFNNSMLILMLVSTSLILFFIGFFYMRNYDSWEDEKFEEKYGSIIEEINKDKRTSLLWVILFLVRRMLFVYFLYHTNWAPLLIVLNIKISPIMICYLIHFKPLKDQKLLRLELFNELVLLMQTYNLMMLSEVNTQRHKSMPYFDILFIIVTAGYILTHLYGVFANLVTSLKQYIKERKERRQNKNKTGKKSKAKKYSKESTDER
jgi:hypothetical protein